MTSASKVILIAEKYYAKLWLGDGPAPSTIDPTTLTANSVYFADPVAKTTLYKEVSPTPSALADYVGKYIDFTQTVKNRDNVDIQTHPVKVLVTADNKESLGITAGTTKAYTALEDMPLPIQPQLGWFYLDATTGKLYVYCGDDTTPWTEAGTWSGGFL